jgi:hypothetical protein
LKEGEIIDFAKKTCFAFRDRFPERLPGWGHEWIPACGMHRALLLVVGRIDHRSIVDRPNPLPGDGMAPFCRPGFEVASGDRLAQGGPWVKPKRAHLWTRTSKSAPKIQARSLCYLGAAAK